MDENKYDLSQTEGREKLFLDLYKKYFFAVARYVSKRGGLLDDARDIFQDALLVYYEKMCDDPEKKKIRSSNYLVGVAKILWIRKHRERHGDVSLDELTVDFEEKETGNPSGEKLMQFLQTAGQKCMELLRGIYYDRLSMNELSERFGFSGERSAASQKFKCLEKVRQTVKEKSLVYEDFVE